MQRRRCTSVQERSLVQQMSSFIRADPTRTKERRIQPPDLIKALSDAVPQL
jgi:hypothetical protein